MRVGACMPTSWMENIKPASSLIVKPRCGEQGNALLIWLVSAVMRWRLKTKQSDMRKININNPEELKRSNWKQAVLCQAMDSHTGLMM